MSRYIPVELRQQITERANYRCEYCLIPERTSYYTFQVDHIISIKHGGTTDLDNLALSCVICNRNKGTDLGTYLDETDQLIRFYHPRTDQWEDHFSWTPEGLIFPQSAIGEATVKILGFNHPDSIMERQLLIASGQYPS